MRGRHDIASFGLAAAAIALVALVAVDAAANAQPVSAPAPSFVVIVHPGNRAATLERSWVADAFLKRVSRWPDGTSVQPVELSGTPAVRRHFAQAVLRRTVEALRSYWQQVIFSGRGLPPVDVAAEDDAVTFVLRHRGGIGYVSAATRLRGARAVSLR